MAEDKDLSWNKKLQALLQVGKYRPAFAAGIVILGALVAALEGIGLSFIYPIIEVAQGNNVESYGRAMQVFVTVYRTLGIPFTLGFLILGIGAAMTIRFTASFILGWMRGKIQKEYERKLRTNTFEKALRSKIKFYDKNGSDRILNAIITETRYSAKTIKSAVISLETLFLALMYFVVMFYIAPQMTILAIFLLGSITIIIRYIIEPAYTAGSRVAEANEQVQRTTQAGTQGIRDVKMFGLTEEILSRFRTSVQRYAQAEIDLTRNNVAVQNFYDLASALSLFTLIYVGFTYTSLSLGRLSIFLVAMFRLSPIVSRLNSQVYNVEGNISHLVRTQEFINELDKNSEPSGSQSIDRINNIIFNDVQFSYNDEETVLEGVSFRIERGEFIGFVGHSGAGKSTIVSLLTRMYRPDGGKIISDRTPIEEYCLEEWRSRIALVRQKPFIFDDTLERNVTIGNRDAPKEDIKRVCEIAQVDEFLNELPDGYETKLGDDGVRLSGGQRQRVALARALLKDADLLVLDEATSDLDSNLERKVQAAVEKMDRNYTIITIAHRLSTLQNADRIYTLEDGKIIEEGTHNELLNAGGKYADLYSIQS